MTRHFSVAVAAILFSTTAWLGAQATFRSGVDVIEVDASVMRGNRPVSGLTAHDFVVTDNRVRQEIVSVTQGEIPLRITLALDTSASVAGKRLAGLIGAGNALAAALQPSDEVSLITFSHKVTLRVPMGNAPATFRTVLSSLSASGGTSLRDAVHLGLLAPPEEHTRSLLLVFSDGLDTTSWLPEQDVIDAARRGNTVIECVRLEDNEFLERLAETTGGRVWPARSERDLAELFTRALTEMRARYVIAYAPAGRPSSGWHEIKVSVAGIRADVTARPRYCVP
jgi:VWFA-related protein